jgi:hypothetical protein
MASQNPIRAAWLHFSQTPPQRASQQTPSVQKLVAHSASAAQAEPLVLRQVPATQVFPAAQSPGTAQVDRQDPVAELQV